MSTIQKRTLPVLIAVIAMLTIFAGFFFDNPTLTAVSSEAKTVATILGVLVLIVGSLRLSQQHVRNTIQRRERWYMSLWLLVVLAVTIILGLVSGTSSSSYNVLFQTLYLFPYATLATLHSFSILSASYRLFRVKNLEGFLFVAAAVLILMRNAPVGETIWTGFPTIGNWIMNVPNLAGQRAILLTGAIAAVFVGLKNLLGIERGWLGVAED